MKTKSFDSPKYIKNYEKKINGTSDVWSTSCLSHQPSIPAYHIADCRIFSDYPGFQPKTTPEQSYATQFIYCKSNMQ